jgi:hypothetical protein
MPIKVAICPHCNKRVFIRIEESDISPVIYPAPVWVIHKNGICDKLSTYYVDSKLGVSYIAPEKKDGAIKTLEALDKM